MNLFVKIPQSQETFAQHFKGTFCGAGCSIDPTFNSNPLDSGTTFRGAQFDGSIAQVTKIFVIPEGSLAGYVLVAGYFNQYNGYPVHSCILLNPDGSYNPSLPFNDNLNKRDVSSIYPDEIFHAHGFNYPPYTFAFQRGTDTGPNAIDWKIMVGGEFANYQGVYKPHILRLTYDGTLDTSFNVSPGYAFDNNGFVNKIIVEPGATPQEDKIIMAGQFSHFYTGGINYSRNNLARLDANGALDISFNVGNGFSDAVADNGFTFGGYHATVKDMFLDTSVTPHLLYACGRFTSYRGAGCDEIIRIDCSNGFRDNAFLLKNGGPNGSGSDRGPVYSMKEHYGANGLSDILIGGNFTTYGVGIIPGTTIPMNNVSRIAVEDGTASKTTNPFSETETAVLAVNELILYPNPSSGKINFITSAFNEKPFSIYVYNPLGQKVYEKTNETAKEAAIDLSDLKAGTYFIMFSNNEKTITKTIILK